MTEKKTAEKKPRKKTPPYKGVEQSGSVSSISEAFSELETLGGECREIVDNASEGLSQTQRIQTLTETADALESISEPDIPEFISDREISYTVMVNTNKRSSPSRAVRRDNAVSILEGAKSELESLIDEHREAAEGYENLDESVRGGVEEPEYTVEQCDEMQTLVDEIETLVGEVESLEFPGMFG